MSLSALQSFILIEAAGWRNGQVPRRIFRRYYDRRTDRPSPTDQQNSLTKSLERLIDRGSLIGYGRRTPKKWFIEEVRLTPAGRRLARSLRRRQPKLPL